MPFDGKSETTVSQDSAFTTPFIIPNLIPANYKDYTIVFKNALVKGTSITMIDWTDEQALKYYYYYYTLSECETSVKLTQFSRMGGTYRVVFTGTNGDGSVEVPYNFIIAE